MEGAGAGAVLAATAGALAAAVRAAAKEGRGWRRRFGLYKILFYFEAFVHESIIRVLPTPTCTALAIAMLLHVYCAIYDAPRPPFCMPCTIPCW